MADGNNTQRIASPAVARCSAGCARTPPSRRCATPSRNCSGGRSATRCRGLWALLADDFIGPDGLDREGARRLAQALFLRYRDVGAGWAAGHRDLQDGTRACASTRR